MVATGNKAINSVKLLLPASLTALITACGGGDALPSPAAIATQPPTATAQRAAPMPTPRPTPTETAQPTETLEAKIAKTPELQTPTSTSTAYPTLMPTSIPTLALAPTFTPTLALTPTFTPTPTALPPTAVFPTKPSLLTEIAKNYPYLHEIGNVRVYSDISPQFSLDHAINLKKVFDYFSKLYRNSRGNAIEVYYTQNIEAFKLVIPYCPTTVVPGGRNLTACYSRIARWFIMPFQIPDFGTQQHEIGHDFLFATWPKSEDYPWFKEGTAMYFESGKFNDNGDLIVTEPAPFCTYFFRKHRSANRLIPLEELFLTPKPEFLADPERTYSQSCMFFHYLQDKHPSALAQIISRINDGKIKTNKDLLSILTSLTGMDTDKLDTAYKQFAQRY